MRTRHLDDFALLRYTAGDLDDSERGSIVHHLDQCEACLLSLADIRGLDAELRRVGSARAETRDPEAGVPFAADDPFRERPRPVPARLPRHTPDFVDRALNASDRGRADVESLLDAAGEPDRLAEFLRGLSFADPEARYLTLYALEQASSRITLEGPARALHLAEATLRRLEHEPPGTEPAETMVPIGSIAGQAHLLAGQAANWTGEFEKARAHLESAYRSFPGDSVGEEIRLALTEYHESQRRSFAGQPGEGLVLARRARSTFDRVGVEDYAARARVSEGIALSALGRDEEATHHYRAAIREFEREGKWKNFVSAINSLGVSLVRLERLDEARREYSRALRRLSQENHPALFAFTRLGLAEVLESAGRHADAAKSFVQAVRAFEAVGLAGDALITSLREIENWARSGDTARALHRLAIFRAAVERLGTLDPFIIGQLEDAVLGRASGFERLGELRRNVANTLRQAMETRAG